MSLAAGEDPFGGFAPPEELVAACGRAGVPCAAFTAGSGFEEVDERLLRAGGPGLLLARTDGAFAPWDEPAFAVRALDALEAGLPLAADAGAPWAGVYGPDLADTVLDLLMDGIGGVATLLPAEPWSEAEFARRLAATAECAPELVVAHARAGGGRAAEAIGFTPLLPPGETMVERFVRERRAARRRSGAAVMRRMDEVRLEAAE